MQTIAWDVDDVLNDLMKSWLERKWLPGHPSCAIRFDDLTQNPPHELLGAGLDEYLLSLDSYRFSEEGRHLPPREDMLDWFRQYGYRFRHVALTATPIQYAPFSASWVFRHFGKWIRSFGFVPSRRSTDPDFQYDTTKKEFLQWWGKADILIDDNALHAEAASQIGVRTILAPRPWNRGEGSLRDLLQTLGQSV